MSEDTKIVDEFIVFISSLYLEEHLRMLKYLREAKDVVQ